MSVLNINFTINDKQETTTCLPGDVFKTIANYIAKVPAPNDVYVETDIGDAEFQLIKKSGAFFVREVYNNINISENEKLGTVYLVMVNPEHNNYKFYKLEDCDNGDILATYGRIGASSNEVFGERTHVYPKRMYWVKLAEKLAKGYKDMSDVYLADEPKDISDASEEMCDTSKTVEKNDASSVLYNTLKAYSTYVIKETCISSIVTEKMVERTKNLLTDLYELTEDVNAFNKKLLEILEVSPRRVRDVNSLLAQTADDFSKIVNREESLLMAMEAVVNKPSATRKSENSFETLNIKVHYATDKQKEEVLRHLNDSLKGKVKNIYRVISQSQKARFNEYIERNNIKKIKQFWHGSRNENWLSIVSNGLLLKPNAVITGKMFGDGIYFAPSAMKSWGYTSGLGSYWARGNSNTSFMGLYAVAYGNPLDVTCACRYTQQGLNLRGFNCVHAHAGTYLRNDEIVFYDEAAVLLNYIVEFQI